MDANMRIARVVRFFSRFRRIQPRSGGCTPR